MKTLTFLLCMLQVLVGISFATELSDRVLGNPARGIAPMQRREWRQITTTNINQTLDANGASGWVFGYTESIKWDPNSKKLFFAGGDHNDDPQFVVFDSLTNSWSRGRPSWMPTKAGLGIAMHGYDHHAVDPSRGYFYTRADYNSRVFKRFNIQTADWSSLSSDVPWSSLPSNNLYSYGNACCGGVDYFPEMDALVVLPGGDGGIYRYKENVGNWETLREGLIGVSSTFQFLEYNPVHKVVVFGGENNMYKLTRDGTVEDLGSPPLTLYLGAGSQGVFSMDPVSGDYLVLSAGSPKSFRIYNVLSNSSTPAPAPLPFTNGVVVATPICTYGITTFITCGSGSGNFPDCHMWLYKHSDPNPTIDYCNAPPLPPPDNSTPSAPRSLRVK